MAIDLIEEAVSAGARRFKACEVLEIDVRTLQRWQKTLPGEAPLVDRRKAAGAKRTPANKLSDEERREILSVCNQPTFQSLPPSQIVPRLADSGEYIASESSFYRVLRDAEQVQRRGAANGHPAERFSGHRPEPGMELGYHLPGVLYPGVFLPALPGVGYLQPQDCRLGSSRQRVGGACQCADR